MGPYHQVVVAAFEEGAMHAVRNGMAGTLHPSTIERNPVLIQALDALDDCGVRDDASAVLSKLADRVRDRAAADRAAPDWHDLALVAGWLADAAARVWTIPSDARGTARSRPDAVAKAGAPRKDWPAFSEPFRAANGMTVEVASSTDDLMRFGRDLDNILQRAVVAASYGSLSAEGRQYVYAVTKDGRALSAGELRPEGDGIEIVWNRGRDNVRPDPRTTMAVEEFVEAVSNGAIPGANAVSEGRFVDRMAASPSMAG